MASRKISLVCWKCGCKSPEVLLPFSRYEECSHCKVDLHCCRQCRYYQPSLANACSHDRADFQLEKEKANFCDFFHAKPNAYVAPDKNAELEARRKLEELFGDSSDSSGEETVEAQQSEADKALSELQRLFGDSD